MWTKRVWVGFTFCVAVCGATTTLATVGDSFADTFYFGLRARPDLLKKSEIELVRWSRPAIGLVRSDQFDYPGWLGGADELGSADFCVVQVGTNDLQSIPSGAGKWIRFPGEAWKAEYTDRVRGMVEMLRTRRCRRVIWVLQPGFEKNGFLSRNRELLNEIQAAGAAERAVVLDVKAETGDYGRDGVHFGGPFALKMADATLRLVTAWRDRAPEGCFACHGSLPAAARLPVPEIAALRLHGDEKLLPPSPAPAETVAHGVVPPKMVRVAKQIARRRHHRRHA